jgi:hypothetical protein
VADSFHWPIDGKKVDAVDLERAAVARGEAPAPEPDVPGLKGNAVAFPARGQAPIPVEAESEDAWFASEEDDLAVPASPSASPAGPSHAEPAQPAPGLTRLTRWAIPLLALVVVAETGWLVFDRISGRSAPQVVVAPPENPSSTGAVALLGGSTPAASPVVTGAQAPSMASPGPAAGAQPSAPAPAGVPDTTVVAPGSVSIPLPFQVQVYEGARFIGINAASLPLTPGTHQLQLVNESLGFRTTERVTVSSGRTTRLAASVPSVLVQLNAIPWAEVLVDGTSVGETPLGNVSMSIGPHTLVFRHPQLGEQTRQVVVTAQGATRVSVDLRK